MSDESFMIELAGRRWAVPHLPFRAIKAIQPALFDVYAEAGGAAITGESVARLSERQLDRLAEATWRAIAHVDPTFALEDFLALPFSVGDLIQAFPAVARAAGLRGRASDNASGTASAPGTTEASSPPGKSISTP